MLHWSTCSTTGFPDSLDLEISHPPGSQWRIGILESSTLPLTDMTDRIKSGATLPETDQHTVMERRCKPADGRSSSFKSNRAASRAVRGSKARATPVCESVIREAVGEGRERRHDQRCREGLSAPRLGRQAQRWPPRSIETPRGDITGELHQNGEGATAGLRRQRPVDRPGPGGVPTENTGPDAPIPIARRAASCERRSKVSSRASTNESEIGLPSSERSRVTHATGGSIFTRGDALSCI